MPPVIEAVVTEYNHVYTALEAVEKLTGTQSQEYSVLYEQKRALEAVLVAYKYMLDWSPTTKQFTVYLDPLVGFLL